MEPVNPVVPNIPHTIYAEEQPEYMALPTVKNPSSLEGPVTSRWAFTDEERELILQGGDLYLTLLTFGNPLQPVLIQVLEGDEQAETTLRAQGYLPPKQNG